MKKNSESGALLTIGVIVLILAVIAAVSFSGDKLMTDPDAYRKASDACRTYMEQNLGSTEKILSTIEV